MHVSINTFNDFKNMSALTCIDIAWNLFETMMNGIQDMASLKEQFAYDLNMKGKMISMSGRFWNILSNHFLQN